MKQDSFEDRKQPEGFEFQIETVSAIKGGGVAVTGKVTEGVLHRGDSAVCVPGAGSSFLCAIQDCPYGYWRNRTEKFQVFRNWF